MQKSSKIFVAGGTGLVGSAIIKRLVELNYDHIHASYLSRQPDEFLSFCGVKFHKLNLLSQKETLEFFKNETPEFVFLAAAKVGGILANNKFRADFIADNLQIQNNVILSCFETKVKKLIYLGSSCIYPKNCPQPILEDYLLTSPLEFTNEPYAIAKIAGIKMCESYNLQHGTNYISVMPTNLYGLNDNFDFQNSHVLPALLRKIHLGKCLEKHDYKSIKDDLIRFATEGIHQNSSETECLQVLSKFGIEHNKEKNQVVIELWGTGNPRREFLHADDMADACVNIMQKIDFKDIIDKKFESFVSEHPDSIKEIRNAHINIGTGVDISISELAEMIKSIIGFNGSFIWNETKPDGTFQKLLDVSFLKSLGWQSSIDLKSGIAKIYESYIHFGK